MEFINSLLPSIEHLGILGYWLVMAISFSESFAFLGEIVPGATLITLAGFFSAQGYLDIGDLIWFTAIGAILSDSLSFWLGEKGSKLFANKIIKNKYLKYIKKGEDFFKKHGNKSIFLGRFIGPLRPVIPFIAGMFKMNKRSFFFWNVLSGFSWAISFLLLGYFLGGSLNIIKTWSSRVGFFITTIILVLIIIRWLINKSKPALSLIISIWNSVKTAIKNNSDIQRFVRKHQKLITFIKKRLDKEKFSGLPLTLSIIAFLYVLAHFLGIIEDVITSDSIIGIDERLANLFFTFRDAKLINFFTWITILGKWQIIATSLLIVTVLLKICKKSIYIIPFWLTVFISEALTFIGKITFQRPRPDISYYIESSFSFPSGHATIAVAFYGFLTYLLLRETNKWKQKTNILFSGLTIILLIGLSRLYLGVHYLSDVWAGYLSGLLILIIGIALVEWVQKKQKNKNNKCTKNKIIVILLITIQIFIYVIFGLNYHPKTQIPPIETAIIISQNIEGKFGKGDLPKFTETPLGDKQEPLSFIIISKNDSHLIQSFEQSGWKLADKVKVKTILKFIKSALLKQEYPRAPMSPSFWNKKPHDFGFEKQTKTKSVKERHHARFWKTNFITPDGNKIYVGTVSLDTNLKLLITHKISPDIDSERELLLQNLKNSEKITDYRKYQFVSPTLGQNFSGDLFFTDGKIYLINLK